ncbi:MAG: hypothetical protein RLZZ324_750 [Candidatus Parcubacteria bacterium]|jgi:hypothetical protein
MTISACKDCNGKGKDVYGFQVTPCTSCGATGFRWETQREKSFLDAIADVRSALEGKTLPAHVCSDMTAFAKSHGLTMSQLRFSKAQVETWETLTTRILAAGMLVHYKECYREYGPCARSSVARKDELVGYMLRHVLGASDLGTTHGDLYQYGIDLPRRPKSAKAKK